MANVRPRLSLMQKSWVQGFIYCRTEEFPAKISAWDAAPLEQVSYVYYHNISISTGTAAKPIFWEFLRLYPSPELAVQAEPRDLASLLNPLGLHQKRAQIIIKFTGQITQ